ncbi:response regulator [Treponema sp. JC4]|uniref:HD-GYP domain-containing protein n=1 Tax=Treponema sp. JC4 TaxID=1124982 RepID=UPI00025AFBA2|nr:HD domain-containing phosphohydrolase [Treponema sp. JC4]EID85635.1 response regulator [Treponema sp. JC4]
MINITRSHVFDENINNVNAMILKIMAFTAIVPTSFILLTVVGIWNVPHTYSVGMLVYCLFATILLKIFNRFPALQRLTMYASIFAAIFFVDLLGAKSIINVTISYGFAPFLSCLYYNVKLTRVSNFVNIISIMIVIWLRSQTVLDNFMWLDHPNQTAMSWFLENGAGTLVESVFVYLITVSLAKRTNKTLDAMIQSSEERNTAIEELKKRNAYIVKINNEIEGTNHNLKNTQYKIIQFVSEVLGSHDLFTGRHVMHTRKYVEIIAKELKKGGYYQKELTDENIELYSTAAFLHDIGKIHIPEGVLNKIGKFTPEEYQLMKIHPEEGKKLLEYLPQIEDGTFNEIAKQMAYCHHEKWDGSGYPNGLKGKEIPLCARIMAAADVLDALISQRLYKEPMPVEEAMAVFERAKGMHFEPCIADAVINLKNLITIIDEDFKTTEASTNAEELEWWMKYHSSTVKIEVHTDFIGASTEPQSAVFTKTL